MRILLGVCGGIAAYKAAELTREFRRRGAEVEVVLTANAERFVTPLTLATLSGKQVMSSLWMPSQPELAAAIPGAFDIEHIEQAKTADIIVIAPATANFLAKMAHGFADDLLSAICLATTRPIAVAPAMNTDMWFHPATEANLQLLRERKVQVIAPASGELACGTVGAGRLADVSVIADHVFQTGEPAQDLTGETVLITVGGTREPIDAVRYIGNRSSGKMGFALAQAATARGAKVVLVHAATSTQPPPCHQEVAVTTAAQMRGAMLHYLPSATMVIMAAAVSDYQVSSPAAHKLKKSDSLTLELVQTPDILKEVASLRKPGTLVAGFAAETGNLLEEGRRKLREKGADLMVANDVSHPDSGFEADVNEALLLTRIREQQIPRMTKRALADRVLDELRSLRQTG